MNYINDWGYLRVSVTELSVIVLSNELQWNIKLRTTLKPLISWFEWFGNKLVQNFVGRMNKFEVGPKDISVGVLLVQED